MSKVLNLHCVYDLEPCCFAFSFQNRHINGFPESMKCKPTRSIYGMVDLGDKLMYTSPLGDIARQYDLGRHFYADDTQLYIAFNPKSINWPGVQIKVLTKKQDLKLINHIVSN